MIRNKIKELIEKAIKQAQKEKLLPDFRMPEICLEHPTEEAHGDYSTNIAMKIGTGIRNQESGIRNSIKIANLLSSKLKAQNSKLFAKVEVAGSGFINFTLSEKYLQKQVGEILVKFQIPNSKFQKSKVQVEFISANPTGLLHLGHGRGAFAGDTLANVLEAAGYDVKREYYINDAKKSGQIRALGKTALGKSKVYLTKYLKEKIGKLSAGLSEEEAGYLVAQEIQKDIRNFIEKKLRIKFDKWIPEQKLYEKGKPDEVKSRLQKKNLVYEKEGALFLETTRFGDDKDRVLIKQGGHPTYLLPDIAYHKDKFDRGFDKVIDIWGADHLGHIKPLKIGLKILGYDAGNLEILITQMVRLKKEGKAYKMSKRKGEVIDLEWLVDEVGLDVTRFLYLMKSLDTQMEFDLDLAREKSEKNPVFYVQYAYARICSIIRKVRRNNADKNAEITLKSASASNQRIDQRKFSGKKLNHPSELNLIRQLIRFPEIVEDTSKDYQVQRLPHYAIEITSCFHYFYKCCRVRMEDKDLMKARLALVLASQIVLKSVLGLMGVSAPEHM